MNDLEKIFYNNEDRVIHKWAHYFEVYEAHFSRFRNKEIVLVEIGLFQGGSINLWKKYFGDKVKIYGIDINPNCKSFEDDQTKVFIGSQSDRNFLRSVVKQIPPIDILIDDGGHSMEQQIVSFEELFDHVKDNGVYLCEDTHTSYWLEYGGGHKRKSSFIEYSKNWIDAINAYHSKEKSLKVDKLTTWIHSVHYYDSIVVIEKRKREKPYHIKKGTDNSAMLMPAKHVDPLKFKIVYALNSFLRSLGLKSYKWR